MYDSDTVHTTSRGVLCFGCSRSKCDQEANLRHCLVRILTRDKSNQQQYLLQYNTPEPPFEEIIHVHFLVLVHKRTHVAGLQMSGTILVCLQYTDGGYIP